MPPGLRIDVEHVKEEVMAAPGLEERFIDVRQNVI